MQERFGIELETISKITREEMAYAIADVLGSENVNLQDFSYHSSNANLWEVKSDSSIHPTRHYQTGAEIVTPPLKIHNLGDVKAVLKALKGLLSVNRSCGMHVHVETNSIETVRNVVRTWYHFEHHILDFFPPSRREQAENTQDRGTYCEAITHEELDYLVNNLDYGKYYQLNASSWAFRGTVEFRGHSATVNFNKIKKWVLFCCQLVSFCKNKSEQELYDELVRFNGTTQSLCEILGIEKRSVNYFEGRQKHFKKLANDRREF